MELKEKLREVESINLLDSEEIRHVEPVDINPPAGYIPVTNEALAWLTNAASTNEIGRNGPAMASASFPGEANSSLKLFEALFGRDSLQIAQDVLGCYPELARTTLKSLSALQGCTYDLFSEEEPGRIVHEVRDWSSDELARNISSDRGWHWPYYGSVDATPKFIHLMTDYARRVPNGFSIFNETYIDKNGQLRQMAHAYRAAIGWVSRRMDSNPEGFLEFKAAFPGSIVNQAWKDSGDAYHHVNGDIANHDNGIASIEVQGETYQALLDAADMFERVFNEPSVAAELKARAERLRCMAIQYLWNDSQGGFFVLGTDRDENGHLRQLAIKTSNMGHLLGSGLLDGNDIDSTDLREALIRQLFSQPMLGLNGIRTLASDEVRYCDQAYHNGSVWPMDNRRISEGLARCGYHRLSNLLNQKQLDVIRDTGLFPEYARGSDDPNHRLNDHIVDVYDGRFDRLNRKAQPPQLVQGWTVSAIKSIESERQAGLTPTAVGSRQDNLERKLLSAIGAWN